MVADGNLILCETSSAYPDLHNFAVKPEKNQEISKGLHDDNRVQIVWRNVILFALLHASAVYGLYLTIFESTWKTFFWSWAIVHLGCCGITVGAHRLWTHRTYKATLPLRILLMICQTIALQNTIYEWVRDHRVHHKYTDTDADPHNSRRGFFFSHIGWLMVKKHKDVKIKGKSIDMSDVEGDPVVRFQKRNYILLILTFTIAIPALVPWYFWGESWRVCLYAAVLFRYTLSLNGTWIVNSIAHKWGTQPYDTSISSVESAFVSLVSGGEGWHNYHHVFPWDYKAGELGNYDLNLSTMWIDMFSKLGWAYDLKTASEDMIIRRKRRTGDDLKTSPENMIWGWGDVDMKPEDVLCVRLHNKL